MEVAILPAKDVILAFNDPCSCGSKSAIPDPKNKKVGKAAHF
jgi:hypothetical protein